MANEGANESVRELRTTREELARSAYELNSANQKIVELENQLKMANEGANEGINESGRELRTTREELARSAYELNSANQKIIELQNAVRLENERCTQKIIEKETAMRNEIATLNSKINDLQGIVDNNLTESNDLNTSQLHNQLNELRETSKLEQDRLNQDLNVLKESIKEKETEIVRLKTELANNRMLNTTRTTTNSNPTTATNASTISKSNFFVFQNENEIFNNFRSRNIGNVLKEMWKVCVTSRKTFRTATEQIDIADMIFLTIYNDYIDETDADFRNMRMDTDLNYLINIGLNKQESIHIKDVTVLYVPFTAMAFFTNLNELRIVGCKLNNSVLNKSFFEKTTKNGIHNVAILDFSNNNLSTMINVVGMKNLRELNLNGNKDLKFEENKAANGIGAYLCNSLLHESGINNICTKTLRIKNTKITKSQVEKLLSVSNIRVESDYTDLNNI